ncbi:putative Vacuolar 14 Fab1-binding region/Vacuolar protein 14 C-terminal Fig4p binding [Leishmania utingensis]|uniref:Vacuolar 14 Fab1-binding region/Vacuolar protein 14 C-terminal Fig4p binding n=1 Tax=Leishmania utingensis TaxID=653362 RepID=A0AAW3ASQ0_9TRYP
MMADPLALQATRKALIEGKADARSRAAQAISSRTLQLYKDVPTTEAEEVLVLELRSVGDQLLRNTAAVYRRAGLICVRAVCAGLPHHPLGSNLLIHLLDPVLRSMGDADPIVRIAAIEACYELVRHHGVEAWAARFTDLFTALSIAVSDRDKRVFLLAEEVSCTLKESVSRSGAAAVDINAFASFVCETLGSHTSSSRSLVVDVGAAVSQWVLQWLRFVLELPGCHFAASMASLLRVLLAASDSNDTNVFDILCECRQGVSQHYSAETAANVCEVVDILCTSVHDATSARTRVFCLEWLSELVHLGIGDDVFQRHLSCVLQATLPELSSHDGATRAAAVTANQEVQHAIVPVGASISAGVADLLLRSVLELLDSGAGEETLIGGLEWLLILHHLAPSTSENLLNNVLEAITVLLDVAAESVALRATEVACVLTSNGHFSEVVQLVLQRLLHHNRDGLLLRRFPDVVRRLHTLRSRLEGEDLRESVLVHFARALSDITDLRFVSKVVLSLQSMLATFPELDDVRVLLRRGLTNTATAEMFSALLQCWRYNAVALLSLGLLCRHFVFTRRICEHLGEGEMSVATYVQLDHLVQQLESSTFTFLRVSLLRPMSCPALVQTLYLLLLLLPQSSPHYATLSRRLQPVTVLVQLDRMAFEPLTAEAQADVPGSDWDHYIAAQEALLQYEQTL